MSTETLTKENSNTLNRSNLDSTEQKKNSLDSKISNLKISNLDLNKIQNQKIKKKNLKYV